MLRPWDRGDVVSPGRMALPNRKVASYNAMLLDTILPRLGSPTVMLVFCSQRQCPCTLPIECGSVGDRPAVRQLRVADGPRYNAEFDPGSGRTLAACLMHASRTQQACLAAWRTAEEHVGINPGVGDIAAKAVASPHTIRKDERRKPLWDEPAAHQVVGRVMAYQADDG